MAYFSSENNSTPSTPSTREMAYVDYTLRQIEAIAGPQGQQLKAYWEAQVNTCPTLNLPFDFPRPRISTFQGDVYLDVLDKNHCAQLRQLAKSASSKPFSVLLSIFYILLGRLTGQTDIPIGVPTSTSNYGQQSVTDDLVGMIANSLLCRVDLSGNPSFSLFLQQVEQSLKIVYDHRDYPLWLLTQGGYRSSTADPLLAVAFSWEEQYPTQEISTLEPGRGLIIEPYPLGEQRGGSFDLYLTVLETPYELQLCWKYSSDLFKHKSIVQFANRFRVLLAAVLANPKQKILQLPCLTKAEQASLLKQVSSFSSVKPPQESIHALFEAQVQRTPDAVAIVSEGESISYQGLNRRANQLAHYLRTKGVYPETLIGIYLQRSITLIIALLGILKSGAAYLPLNPDLPQERLDYMLKASKLNFLLSESYLSKKITGDTFEVICFDTDWYSISQQSKQNPSSLTTPQNLAYVIYTSGSTGRPKGVMIEHQAVSNFIQAAISHYGFTATDRVLQFASISFDAAVEEIYPCLSVGGTLILRPPTMLDSFPAFLQHCQEYGLTVLDLPTAFWHQLVDFLLATPNADIPDSIRLVIIGGEKVDAKHVHDWYSQLKHAPLVVNTYGPTEATVVATLYKISAASLSTDNPTCPTHIPIGKALNNVETYILDDQAQLMPPGVVGELHIGGIGLARSYLNAPEQTQARFIPDPFHANARLYKTGDLVRYLPNGNLEYVGRADHQVKIRGYRVELGEIESVITQYPEVQQALVIAQQPSLSQSQQLIAYVVTHVNRKQIPSESQQVTGAAQKAFKQDLKQYLATKLPNYMIPSAFVLMDAFPLNPNGKVDRSILPLPINDDLGSHIPVEDMPSTPTEKELARLWQGILGDQNIGVHTNFLDLGGNSLQVIEILTQIQTCFEIRVSTQAFLENPTLAQLATLINAQEQSFNVNQQPVTVNLMVEAQLDETIQFANLTASINWPVENIFLTGGTGSIGPYLLSELLQQTTANVYCLVRTKDLQAGKKKIIDCLQAIRRWQPVFRDRIIPICGDLSRPLLGITQSDFENLADQIDVIYHNGAWVNFVYSYLSLKDTNVRGTQEILRLAGRHKIKPVHYISTLSVFTELSEQQTVILETDLPNLMVDRDSGYDQTKCVAEHLINVARHRGLPASIYRLGTVLSYDFQDSAVNLRPNFFKSLMQDCLNFQKIPDLNQIINLTPIDYIGKTIAYLSQQQPSLNQTFHVINPNYLTWDALFHELVQLSPGLKKVSYSEWLMALNKHIQQDKSSALKPFLGLLDLSMDFPLEKIYFDCQQTQLSLTDTSINSPTINANLFREYWPNLFKMC